MSIDRHHNPFTTPSTGVPPSPNGERIVKLIGYDAGPADCRRSQKLGTPRTVKPGATKRKPPKADPFDYITANARGGRHLLEVAGSPHIHSRSR